jgi:pyruvate formate lyase activating enzyme
LKDHGTVFDIQRFSVHDGPGIRTLVFLKGCRLRCEWCSNPESQRFLPDLLFDPERCIGCENCLERCSNEAIKQNGGQLVFEPDLCVSCGECATECYAEARVLKGRTMHAKEVVEEVLKDEAFYTDSGGGMTLSGGEPLDQTDFSEAILKLCKQKGIHTAIETAGNVSWGNFEQVLPYTDLFLFDVKHTDNHKLSAFTGADADLIHSNLEKLMHHTRNVILRTPVIPGFNDTVDEIRTIAQYAKNLGVTQLHLLPYHRFGLGKYKLMGRTYAFKCSEKLPDECVQELKETASRQGLSVQVGG